MHYRAQSLRSGQPLQSGADNPVNMAGLDIAQQLQLIVRGELRRMIEVTFQDFFSKQKDGHKFANYS